MEFETWFINTLFLPGSALLSDCSFLCPNGPPPSTCFASGKQLWTNGIRAYEPKLLSAFEHRNMKVELDLSLSSPVCGLLTWCVAILNICRFHQSFSHQLLTSSTKVCNSRDPGVVSPSEALVFWSQEAAQRWDLVVMTHKGPLLSLCSLECLLSKGKLFRINLFNNYPKYRSLWKL